MKIEGFQPWDRKKAPELALAIILHWLNPKFNRFEVKFYQDFVTKLSENDHKIWFKNQVSLVSGSTGYDDSLIDRAENLAKKAIEKIEQLGGKVKLLNQ